MAKTWSVGNKVIFRPQYWSIQYQPWEIVAIEEYHGVRTIKVKSAGEASNYERHVAMKSPFLGAFEPNLPIQEQFDAAKAKVTRCNKTWHNMAIGEYYRKWAGGKSFTYFKVVEKTVKEPTDYPYYIKMLYKTPWRTKVTEYEVSRKEAGNRIFGRDYKHVPKLEGLMQLGV
jgi:hypothetical protein